MSKAIAKRRVREEVQEGQENGVKRPRRRESVRYITNKDVEKIVHKAISPLSEADLWVEGREDGPHFPDTEEGHFEFRIGCNLTPRCTFVLRFSQYEPYNNFLLSKESMLLFLEGE